MGEHEKGCPYCGGKLNWGNYIRKPRGAIAEAEKYLNKRFSLCCSKCRKRVTPKTVRFLGRKVYVGAFVVLSSAKLEDYTKVSAIINYFKFNLKISKKTLKRWQVWWKNEFLSSSLWMRERGKFHKDIESPLIVSYLVKSFSKINLYKYLILSKLLKFLSALTI